jgi:hypothetical protein
MRTLSYTNTIAHREASTSPPRVLALQEVPADEAANEAALERPAIKRFGIAGGSA